MKRNVLTVLGGALASSIFVLAFLLVQPAGAQDVSGEAQTQPVAGTLEYKGTSAAALEGEVAPRIDGLVTAIKFKAGQFVNKGISCSSSAARTRNARLHWLGLR